jgi:hypothetical protein
VRAAIGKPRAPGAWAGPSNGNVPTGPSEIRTFAAGMPHLHNGGSSARCAADAEPSNLVAECKTLPGFGQRQVARTMFGNFTMDCVPIVYLNKRL